MTSSRLLAAVTAALLPAGASQAALAARALLESDLAGHHQFGVDLLVDLVAGDRSQKLAVPRTERADGPRVDLDAGGTFGPIAASHAAVVALDLVRTHGTAAVAVGGLGRLGRLAPYVRWLAEHGVVALLAANAPSAVAPAGGHDPVLGTNPVAAALPVDGGRPLVVDTATSALTQAAVREAVRDGRPLPPAVALDSQGRPTVDAAEAHAILPRGDSFGSAIGLIVEILVAGITGSSSVAAPPRSAVLLAFRADPRAGHAGASLLERWVHAGGYVPGARDPDVGDEPAQEIAVSSAARRALDLLAPGW